MGEPRVSETKDEHSQASHPLVPPDLQAFEPLKDSTPGQEYLPERPCEPSSSQPPSTEPRSKESPSGSSLHPLAADAQLLAEDPLTGAPRTPVATSDVLPRPTRPTNSMDEGRHEQLLLSGPARTVERLIQAPGATGMSDGPSQLGAAPLRPLEGTAVPDIKAQLGPERGPRRGAPVSDGPVMSLNAAQGISSRDPPHTPTLHPRDGLGLKELQAEFALTNSEWQGRERDLTAQLEQRAAAAGGRSEPPQEGGSVREGFRGLDQAESQQGRANPGPGPGGGRPIETPRGGELEPSIAQHRLASVAAGEERGLAVAGAEIGVGREEPVSATPPSLQLPLGIPLESSLRGRVHCLRTLLS